LVLTIPLTELGNKVSLFKVGAKDNPECPKDVEKQTIGAYVRGRPEENNHEEIERVAEPEIRTAKDKVWWPELLATQMNLDGDQTKCIKVSECPHSPEKAND